MKCLNCGNENEMCNEVCYKCGAALKKFKIDVFTKILIIVNMLIAVDIGLSRLISLIFYFSVLEANSRIIFGLLAVINILIIIGSVLFLVKKKKIYIILNGIGWLLFFVCVYFGGGSPIFAIILTLPYIFAVLRIIPKWKQLG